MHNHDIGKCQKVNFNEQLVSQLAVWVGGCDAKSSLKSQRDHPNS